MQISFPSQSSNVPPSQPPPDKNSFPSSKSGEMRKIICSHCHKENPAAKVCGRCKLIYYCNSECQKAHWIFHKTICKEPQKVNIRYTAWDFDGGKNNTKQSMKIYSAEASQQAFTKRIGLPVVQSNIFEGLTGKNMNVRAENDLICFTGKYSTGFVANLKKHGYSGLKNIDSEKLEELLKTQNYIKILKHIWSEKDVEYKLNWLREQAVKGHVILMFEIGRAVLELQKPSTNLILEAYRWRTLGRIHTHLDAACFGDPSLVSASSDLTDCYNLDPLFQNFISNREKKAFAEQVQAQNNLIKDIQLKETDPSPKWLLYHGINFFVGVDTAATPEKWLELRSNRLEMMIREFSQKSQKGDKN